MPAHGQPEVAGRLHRHARLATTRRRVRAKSTSGVELNRSGRPCPWATGPRTPASRGTQTAPRRVSVEHPKDDPYALDQAARRRSETVPMGSHHRCWRGESSRPLSPAHRPERARLVRSAKFQGTRWQALLNRQFLPGRLAILESSDASRGLEELSASLPIIRAIRPQRPVIDGGLALSFNEQTQISPERDLLNNPYIRWSLMIVGVSIGFLVLDIMMRRPLLRELASCAAAVEP